jgi:hypothetical protein
MTKASRIIAALKSRGETPATVMKRLGLDMSLLRTAAEPEGKSYDAAEPTSERELLLSMHESIGNILKQRANAHPEGQRGGTGGSEVRGEDDFPVPATRSSVPPKVETNIEDLSSGSDDEDPYREFSDYLQDCGLSKDEATQACRIVRDSRRGRGNGYDKNFGRDRFPQRAHHSPISDPAMDARRAARFPNMARIVCEPEARRLSGDRRLAHDKRPPSSTRRSRTLARFPEMAAIKTGADTGFVFRDEKPTKPGRFEV